jgi:hypothetical protein
LIPFNVVENERIWEKIHDFASKNINEPLLILNPVKEKRFKITKVTDSYLIVDKLGTSLTKEMFVIIFNHIKSSGNWMDIGASHVNTRKNTIEGILKERFFGGNMNAISTATWVAAILVRSDVGISFNNVPRGQALKYNKN